MAFCANCAKISPLKVYRCEKSPRVLDIVLTRAWYTVAKKLKTPFIESSGWTTNDGKNLKNHTKLVDKLIKHFSFRDLNHL